MPSEKFKLWNNTIRNLIDAYVEDKGGAPSKEESHRL